MICILTVSIGHIMSVCHIAELESNSLMDTLQIVDQGERLTGFMFSKSIMSSYGEACGARTEKGRLTVTRHYWILQWFSHY